MDTMIDTTLKLTQAIIKRDHWLRVIESGMETDWDAQEMLRQEERKIEELSKQT